MLTSRTPSPSPPSSPSHSPTSSSPHLFRRPLNPAQKSAPSSYRQYYSPPPPSSAAGTGGASGGSGASAGPTPKPSNNPNRHSTTSLPSREHRHSHSHSHSHSHYRSNRSSSEAIVSTTTTSSTAGPKKAKRRLSMQSHFKHFAPEITTHLTDRDSNPILSTHPSPSSPALLSLSSAFVQAYETAAHLGLGVPQRVMLSATGGNVLVIQTAANSQHEEEKLAAAAAAAAAAGGAMPSAIPQVIGDDAANAGNALQAGAVQGHTQQSTMVGAAAGNAPDGPVDPEASGNSNGMLVGTIVAPVGQTAEAMVASWGIEDVAKRLQDGIGNK